MKGFLKVWPHLIILLLTETEFEKNIRIRIWAEHQTSLSPRIKLLDESGETMGAVPIPQPPLI